MLDRRSYSSCAAGRHSNAKWEGLGGTLAEVGRSSHLDISGEQNVFGTVHFLNPLTVGKRYPHGFLVGLEHPCFHLDSFTLNVFVSINIDLSYDRLSFCKGCLVESYPDFTLWRNQMIEQTQRLSFPTLNPYVSKDTYQESVTLMTPSGENVERVHTALLCQKV